MFKIPGLENLTTLLVCATEKQVWMTVCLRPVQSPACVSVSIAPCCCNDTSSITCIVIINQNVGQIYK